jgi:hypothetical protein
VEQPAEAIRDCKNNGVTPKMEETPVTIETMAKKEPEVAPASTLVDQKVMAELVARASASCGWPARTPPGATAGSTASCADWAIGRRQHGVDHPHSRRS